jgi:hypothetical protein
MRGQIQSLGEERRCVLENRGAKKERRDPNRMQGGNFGKVKCRLRKERLERDTRLLAFAGSDEGDRTLMSLLRRVFMKAFMKLRRDCEAKGEEKSREQTTDNDGAKMPARAHAKRKMDLSRKVGKSFPFGADWDAKCWVGWASRPPVLASCQNNLFKFVIARLDHRQAGCSPYPSDLTTELEEQHFRGGIFAIIKPQRTVLAPMVGADAAAGSAAVDLMNSKTRSQVKRAPGFQKNCAATFVGEKILQCLSFHLPVSYLRF